MDNKEELERKLNELADKFAEGISTLIRSINNKEKIIEFLKGMKNQLPIEILKRINKIAIEKEDYETCDALKEYSTERGLTL